MVKLARALSQFRPFKALVLGDFMLDTYTTGRVKRISPEAPVPVMEVLSEEKRPGGAGNVVLSLAKFSAEVFAFGRIGKDEPGEELKKLLAIADTTFLKVDSSYKTPVKNRLIADSQQLLRVDFETASSISPIFEAEVMEELKAVIPKVDIVAISDYGKGFLTEKLIQAALALARKANIASIVDPKGADFTKYRGATLIKPNLSEAYTAARCPPTTSLNQVAQELLPLTEILLITRSEEGISIFTSNGRSDFPVRSKEVKDVTGAGDTVLAMICVGLANQLDIHLTAQLANIAAGLAIERLGCVQVTLSQLAERLLEIDFATKIFDESNTYALQEVLRGKKYSLLVLEKGQLMSSALFRTIRKLSSHSDQELIIYVRDSAPDDELIHVLSSLSEINYIILQTESLKNLCNAIHPEEIYFVEQTEAVQKAKELLHKLLC